MLTLQKRRALRSTSDVSKSLILFFVVLHFSACRQATESHPEAHSPQTDTLTPNQISLLQPGDIICRRGFGMVSELVASFASENGEISHCGILIKKPTEWLVVHSTSQAVSEREGLQRTSLHQFMAHSRRGSIKVFRLKTNPENKLTFARKTDSISQLSIPFDNQFDLQDASELYCTELLQVLLKQAGVEIQLDYRMFEERPVLTFHAFGDTSLFESVLFSTK